MPCEREGFVRGSERVSQWMACWCVASLVSCSGPTAPAGKPVDAGPPPPPPEVTLLITGDEGGWILAAGEAGKEKGGAAETLARWTSLEHHADDALGPEGQAANPTDGTLALSTGDQGPGPAISAAFLGKPMAEVMRQMGYAASAFGRHELGFGREQFLKNREAAGFQYLAANLKVKTDAAKGFDLPPFKIFKRRDFAIAAVGLVNINAAQTTMPGRFDGLEIQGYADALAKAIPAAWEAGADAVVVLADGCPADLRPILEKHADWKVTLAAAGHCGDHSDAKAGETPIVYPGRHFEQYVSAKLTFDPKKPAKERLVNVDVKHVEVAAGKDAPNPNASLAIYIDGWKKKLDNQLGEKIGYTKTGLSDDSPQLDKWVTTALREVLKTDMAVANRGGIREGIGSGDITRASVYSMLPFENSLIICKIKGADLAKELANKQAVFSGSKAGNKFKDAKGKPLDPKKVYTVAMGDFIYFGGDGFHFDKEDPRGVETGMTWQTPVIEWTKREKLGPKDPLEKKLK
jgi:5'-nucleotidase/UDP-sugar diphosphatase